MQPYFDEFIENISLGPKQEERIDSAYNGLTEHLQNELGMSEQEIVLQGSYPNNTAVRPPHGGEYDVDVVVISASDSDTADDALNDMQRALEAHGRYKNRLEPRKPCIRIRYADDEIGSFHVDVVPTRGGQLDPDGPLDAPRRGDGWHATNPEEYTEWCRDQGEHFARTVKSLKRWRDDQQDKRAAIKSIVLQVLVEQQMPPLTDDAERLAQTLNNLHQSLVAYRSTVPIVPNPVLPTENLAARWTLADFRDFRQRIAAASAIAQRAVSAADPVDAAAHWRELLGEDFPQPPADQSGLALGDVSHARTIQDQGWVWAPASNFQISVRADILGENGRRVLGRDLTGSTFAIPAGWKLLFHADVVSPQPTEVWWQVVNTGSHAASDTGGLRGDFFRGKNLDGTPSQDRRLNWENTRYAGKHWIEAFLVNRDVVVARSQPLFVNIRNPQWKSRF